MQKINTEIDMHKIMWNCPYGYGDPKPLVYEVRFYTGTSGLIFTERNYMHYEIRTPEAITSLVNALRKCPGTPIDTETGQHEEVGAIDSSGKCFFLKFKPRDRNNGDRITVNGNSTIYVEYAKRMVIVLESLAASMGPSVTRPVDLFDL